jgi:hypothetical protein
MTISKQTETIEQVYQIYLFDNCDNIVKGELFQGNLDQAFDEAMKEFNDQSWAWTDCKFFIVRNENDEVVFINTDSDQFDKSSIDMAMDEYKDEEFVDHTEEIEEQKRLNEEIEHYLNNKL